MKYNGKVKKVIINGREYDAFFPNRHSRVKGVIFIYNEWDANRHDSYANIRDMKKYIFLAVLWKKGKKWEVIVEGSKNNSKYILYERQSWNTGRASNDYVLFQMETEERREKIELKDTITSLKKEIKEREKELRYVTRRLEKIK